MAYFWLSIVQYAFVPSISVNRHKRLFLAMLKRYINIFKYGYKKFSTKQQVLKFYVIYAGAISKQKSLFADKAKE